ncbi:MAG: thiopeptide-type bacteriocin [Planctomycetaceae bacterium]
MSQATALPDVSASAGSACSWFRICSP